MNGKLVGAMHKRGSFTNDKTGEVINYDNCELVILCPISTGGKYEPVSAVGLAPEKVAKFPFERIHEVFGENVHDVSDLSPYIGRDVEYFYDGSKKICRVLFNGK